MSLPTAVAVDAEPSPKRVRYWVGSLFFAEGIIFTAIASVSAILLKRLGLSNAAIASYISLLILPYSLRPLWSPLLEVFKTNRFFVVLTEALIAVCLFGIAASLHLDSPVAVCFFLLAVASICGSTHDIAADGLFVRGLDARAQERYVGWLSVAFNTAKLTGQGLIVVMAGALEDMQLGIRAAWQAAFVALALITAGLALFHLRQLPPEVDRKPGSFSDIRLKSRDVVTTFFQKKGLLLAVLVVVLYRLTEGQLGRIVPLFLLDPQAAGGLGLSTTALGTGYGVLGPCGFMTGTLAGGWIVYRLGLRRILAAFCLMSNLPALIYLYLALSPAHAGRLVEAAVMLEQAAYGVGSIGLKLVMMQRLAAGPYSTAHLAFATGLSAVAVTFGGMASGALQTYLGYASFFGWVFVASVPAVVVAYLYSKREDW
jgi:PAT family beta-lactamase induction signal transducer AmpG